MLPPRAAKAPGIGGALQWEPAACSSGEKLGHEHVQGCSEVGELTD